MTVFISGPYQPHQKKVTHTQMRNNIWNEN